MPEQTPDTHAWLLHAPQLTLRDVPQLSVTVMELQFLPSRVQIAASESGVQHVFGSEPAAVAQTCSAVHDPQDVERDAPQLSMPLTVPQVFPRRVQKAAFVSAVQPQTLLVPQTCGCKHVPQFTVRDTPQLSAAVTEPQFLPVRAHICASVSRLQQALTGVAGACAHS
jgi:hypothetical protein